MEAPVSQSPVLLIATEGEWAGRSLESVFERHGYTILRAEDGRDALGRALQRRPDAILLDEHLPGIGGIEVCQLLSEDPGFDGSTPIIITASAPAPRTVRSAAYRAGAWEFCTQPLDVDTLILQLGTFLRGRREIARRRDLGLIDSAAGVLTAEGMERWAEQLAARASRNHEPLACVVLTPVTHATHPDSDPQHNRDSDRAAAAFLQLSRGSFRRSDIIGRTNDGRLVLLAPETDEEGVQGMLARLRLTLVTASPSTDLPEQSTFRAGYWAVQDFASSPLDPPELMRRAMRAHDHLNQSPQDRIAIGFDQLPVS